MARFFIDRPIFAWVIAIIMMMAGALAIYTLPIEQYPTVAPPQVSIAGNYPGASAKTVEDSVTQVIEQQMNGIDNLLYMSSSSDSFGNAAVNLTFAPGTDPDIAQVQVQNKLQLATPLLPQEVQQQGMQVTKSSDSFLMVAAFTSEDGSLSRADLADYIASNVQDPVSRVPGVGQIQLFGSPYAMRIWLDPNKLNKFDLTPQDITQTIQVQNNQVASGQLGLLYLEGLGGVLEGQLKLLQLVRAQPATHGGGGAEQLDLAHDRYAADRVMDVGGNIIGQVRP